MVLAYLNGLTNLKVFPLALFKSASLTIAHHSWAVILLIVTTVSFSVFEQILEGRDSDDERQWEQNSGFASRNGNGRDHLQNTDEEEVNVGHLGELLDQVLRQKRDRGVLGCANFVSPE